MPKTKKGWMLLDDHDKEYKELIDGLRKLSKTEEPEPETKEAPPDDALQAEIESLEDESAKLYKQAVKKEEKK